MERYDIELRRSRYRSEIQPYGTRLDYPFRIEHLKDRHRLGATDLPHFLQNYELQPLYQPGARNENPPVEY